MVLQNLVKTIASGNHNSLKETIVCNRCDGRGGCLSLDMSKMVFALKIGVKVSKNYYKYYDLINN